ncbi:hypothetical protein ACFOW6_01590 [Fodinicurvata halophila]|uniref:Uncharacterized protein n=1 Tax=Fodinicurvata halophila TaxID=1419723 RepID=A0ABV8UG35_9PROT
MQPTLYSYTAAFQEKAAQELGCLPPPCRRNVVSEDCSAVGTFVEDYGSVRAEIRAIEDR